MSGGAPAEHGRGHPLQRVAPDDGPVGPAGEGSPSGEERAEGVAAGGAGGAEAAEGGGAVRGQLRGLDGRRAAERREARALGEARLRESLAEERACDDVKKGDSGR